MLLHAVDRCTCASHSMTLLGVFAEILVGKSWVRGLVHMQLGSTVTEDLWGRIKEGGGLPCQHGVAARIVRVCCTRCCARRECGAVAGALHCCQVYVTLPHNPTVTTPLYSLAAFTVVEGLVPLATPTPVKLTIAPSSLLTTLTNGTRIHDSGEYVWACLQGGGWAVGHSSMRLSPGARVDVWGYTTVCRDV